MSDIGRPSGIRLCMIPNSDCIGPVRKRGVKSALTQILRLSDLSQLL